jgi:hypothetical protein
MMTTLRWTTSSGRSEMRRLRTICCFAALAPSLWIGCSDSSPAGTSAVVAEAGITPEGPSPTTDALAADPGMDASGETTPFPGAWSTAPGTPAYCNLRIADNPASLASKWIACPSGRVGCRQIDTSWTNNQGQKLEAQTVSDPIRLVGDVPYFKIRRTWPPADPTKGPWFAFADVIEPLDGAPVIAVGAAAFQYQGEPRWCSIAGAFGDYGFGFFAVPRDPAIPLSMMGADLTIFGWASWADPGSLTTKAWSPSEIGAPGAYFVSVTMGDRGFWLDGLSPKTTYGFDVTTQTGLLAQDRQHTEAPVGVPGGALVFETSSPYAIAFLKDDGSHGRLITPTAPQYVTWKTMDRSSGNDLVWVESDDGFEYKNATLWTAPLRASEGAIVRRKVAKLDDALFRGGARSPANKGVFLSLVGRSTALLTRLSDGMGWLIQAEPQQRFVDSVWVDDNDVFLETAEDPTPQYDLPQSGIMRLSRATLGAPTVPSGL